MADDTGEIGREAAEAVGFRNIKETEVIAGAPAYYSGLAMQNAVNHQHAMNLKIQQQADVGAAISAKAAELIMAVSPSEGGADVMALAQLAKGVQMTPPPTNLPTQGQ